MSDNVKKYASDQKFDGQRASGGRVVLVNLGSGPQAGIVSHIDTASDKPVIHVLEAGNVVNGLAFHEGVKDEKGSNNLPRGSWCWPARL